MVLDKITHQELIELGQKWLIKPYSACADYGHYGCSVVLTELCTATHSGEQPDVLGFNNRDSILIECKVSRSDFYRDKDKPFRQVPDFGVGSQRWYLAPQGIIPVEKVPEIELPECCTKCGMYYKRMVYVDTHYMCAALNKEIRYNDKAYTQRFSGCPLKPQYENGDQNE